MNTRLRYLSFSDVSEGMVLGAPLTIAEHGIANFSLPAGHVLTESNIRQMAVRRGEFACIAVDDPRSDEERAAEQAALTERLEHIFQVADRANPAIAGLYAAVLAYRSM